MGQDFGRLIQAGRSFGVAPFLMGVQRMRFRYNGPNDGTRTLGLAFRKGEPVEVEDQAKIAKLKGNSHFEVVTGRPAKVATDGNEG